MRAVMGEHRRTKLCAIERWLRSKYGQSASKTLDHIYSEEYQARWNPKKPFEADYVQEIGGKMIYVDVFSPNDDWRTVLGKAICYTANAERAGGEYEVWLVTDFEDDPKTARLTGDAYKRNIDGWKMWFRDFKGLIDSTLRPGIHERVKILHAVRSGDGLSLEPIG